jgi:putative ABC transport system permease protein
LQAAVLLRRIIAACGVCHKPKGVKKVCKFAWQNLSRRKGQSFLTILITLLTVMVFVMIFAFYINFQQGVALSQKRLGADILVLPNEASTDAYTTLYTAEPNNIYMPVEVLDSIKKVEGIAIASPQLFIQTLNASCCAVDSETRIVAFDMDTDFVLQPWFHEANLDFLADDEIIIGCDVPAYLGNRVGILGDVFRIVGTMSPTGTGMDETYFMNMDVAKRLAATNENLKEVLPDIDPQAVYSAILIKVQDGYNVADVVANIEEASLNVSIVVTDEVVTSMKKQMSMIGQVMILLWVLLLVVTALALIGRFTALAQVRKKEMGILRAIGGQKTDVFKLILLEACFLAGIGGMLGSILGTCAVSPLIEWLQQAFTFSILALNPGLIAKSLLLGTCMAILLGGLAALYPACKSARLDPQEVIMRGEID